MHIVENNQDTSGRDKPGRDAHRREADDRRAADAYARMMEEILIDIDELDPVACPPDRRFFLRDKEAWVYEHGNVSELVYVRTGNDAFDPD